MDEEAQIKQFQNMIESILSTKKISQRQLAHKIGVTSAQISRWRIGQCPKFTHYLKIQEIYNKMTA